MNAEIWKQCLENIENTLASFKAKGAEVRELEILSPVPQSQIDEFEGETGLKLPEDFVALMELTGGVQFAWDLNVSGTSEYLQPPVKFAEYGGNWELPLIGATSEYSLLNLYRIFQDDYQDYEVEDSQQQTLIKNCFPIYLNDGDGNALAMRLDTNPAEIHVLQAEFCWHLFEKPSPPDRSLVDSGLTNFLTRWTSVGAPATNEILDALKVCGGENFDPDNQLCRTWLAWLAGSDKTGKC